MHFQNKEILFHLEMQVRGLLHFAQTLKSLEAGDLQRRPDLQSWNILECLEHLNLYGDFYLPAVRQAIATAPPASEKSYRSGWLGNYFVNSMVPKEGAKKIKTFKDKNPIGTALNQDAINRFASQQEQLLQLLKLAGSVSLQRTKVPLSIAPWLKLRLGDVLRFVVAHELRHKAQIARILGPQTLNNA